jgi:uncharacterized cupredoxin-like copper-binding protein
VKKTIYLIIILALSLSACQSNRPLTKLDVELSDFVISPDHFIVQAGKQVTIQVTNIGHVDHDFTILKFGADAGASFDYEDKLNIILELKVGPGETEKVTFQVPHQTGIYQVDCSLPGHLQAGMHATLEVVE